MPEQDPIVFVVDDDEAVRDSLRFLLRSVGLLAETYASAVDFLKDHERTRPGCLILDVRMPGMSGMELQERLRAEGSTLPIIFLTAHGDVPMAVEAVKAGAVDFLQKPFRDQDLLDRIQEALNANARARKESVEQDEIRSRIDSLTPREREVMEAVVAGRANKVIALNLGVSQRTVEIHRARVMKKMRARSLSGLVQMVMRAHE